MPSAGDRIPHPCSCRGATRHDQTPATRVMPGRRSLQLPRILVRIYVAITRAAARQCVGNSNGLLLLGEPAGKLGRRPVHDADHKDHGRLP